MDARQIISAIRDGQTLDRNALNWFAAGLANGDVSDAQAGAFAMAVLLNGLGPEGRVDLTLAMQNSGQTLRWSLNGPVVDKHSTGGLGDCVSLVLAPALAACGAYVPMISGRGLGHTGGTLDKIEAIPGLNTHLDEQQLRRVIDVAGCVVAGASEHIAPADRRLYAVRDVTGTVESIDLITASILSKKLASGIDHLVLDVKTGSGAFMTLEKDAVELAKALTDTANFAGCRTNALVTDMNQPLASSVGNALEVAETMRVLTGEKNGALADMTIALGGIALVCSGLAKDVESGADMIAKTLADGRAAEKFGLMVGAMGGPVRFVEDWRRFLPEATVIREMLAPNAGYISAIDGQAIGLVVVGLGGGRQVESDKIDLSVGLSEVLPLGARVEKGQPMLRIHAAREAQADIVEAQLREVIKINVNAPDVPALIRQRIA